MEDWRSELRALANFGATDLFPLLIYRVNCPSETPWPSELAAPSATVRAFYQICDGGYLGGHHRFFTLAELLPENRWWWDLQQERDPKAIDPAHHVILAYETSGFPVVWDCRTDQVVTFFYRDRDDLNPSGPTLDELLAEIFRPDYFDESWLEALGQFRTEVARRANPRA